MGIELEWLPVAADTGRVLPVDPAPGHGRSSLELLRVHGETLDWRTTRTSAGVPQLVLPLGGALTFEPGGQLELATPALPGVGALLTHVRDVVEPLARTAADRGVRFVARGIDPSNPLEAASLELDTERYRRMDAHFGRRGCEGRRMMRQTAGVHVSLDLERDPLLRWSVANRMAPLLLAAFANSPRYGGRPTGHRSFRAAQWRCIDPTRTGLPLDPAGPVEAYLEFALEALDFLEDPPGEDPEPFRVRAAEASQEVWRRHLSTLFPEVRPRGYLEIRCLDGLPLPLLAPLLATLVGVLYDPRALREADEALPLPDADLLERAGREGVRDPELRAGACELLTLGGEGAARLGEAAVDGWVLEALDAFLADTTRRGRDPGDGSDDGLLAGLSGA